MAKQYTPELIEKIERFLNGEMTESERSVFEKEINEDEELRQSVDQHRMMMEGIQVSAYQKEKERWSAVSSAIDLDAEAEDLIAGAEDTSNGKKEAKVMRVPRLLMAVAAGLLIGLLGANIFFKSSSSIQELPSNNEMPVAQNDDEEMPLGNLGTEVEKEIKCFEAKKGNGKIEIQSESNRAIKIKGEDVDFPSYTLSNENLNLFFYDKNMSEILTGKIEWWNIDGSAYLKLGEDFFPLFESAEQKRIGTIEIQ